MAAGGMPDATFMAQTKTIEVSKDKCKYINSAYKKVKATMYDHKCDIKLQVEKECFRAHRDVLAEASDYFSAMFGHDMIEKDKSAVVLKDISPLGFRCMMDYFYHGHVNVDPNNVDDILEAARFFHIEWLIKVCRQFLVQRLSMDNYLRVLELADRFVLGDLRQDIFKFVAYRFSDLALKPIFMDVSQELIYDLLAVDHYIDASEGFIFKTVWRWLVHDPDERQEFKEELLKLIRFPLLEAEELEEIPDEVLEVTGIREAVEEAKRYQDQPSGQCLSHSEMAEVRGAEEALVLYSAVDDANLMQFKIPGMNDFFQVKQDTQFMQSVFEFASTAVLGNFLFVAGGYDRHTWCSSPALYRYNPRNQLWAQLSSMKQPRVSFALCAGAEGLYAVTGIEHLMEDGVDRELILHTAEYYNPEVNLWHFITEMPLGSFNSAACVVDSKVYVTGGISDDPEDTVPVNYLHVYDPDTEVWEAKSGMITEHQGHGMAHLDQKLYVFGGYEAADDLTSFSNCHKSEMYDIKYDQWTRIKDTPAEFGHFHSSVATLGKDIYILGGQQSWRTFHRYDTEKEEFVSAESCGHDVQKVVTMRVALPLDLIPEGRSIEPESLA